MEDTENHNFIVFTDFWVLLNVGYRTKISGTKYKKKNDERTIRSTEIHTTKMLGAIFSIGIHILMCIGRSLPLTSFVGRNLRISIESQISFKPEKSRGNLNLKK